MVESPRVLVSPRLRGVPRYRLPGKHGQLVTLLERLVYFLKNILQKEVLNTLGKYNIKDDLAQSQINSVQLELHQ